MHVRSGQKRKGFTERERVTNVWEGDSKCVLKIGVGGTGKRARLAECIEKCELLIKIVRSVLYAQRMRNVSGTYRNV